MRTIYKFVLNTPQESNYVEMPIGSKICHIDEQHEAICIWAEVETDLPMEIRRIQVYSTGNPIPDYYGLYHKYLGTVKLESGNFIFHLYELNDSSNPKKFLREVS
jgi:hypothetical protein